MYVYTTLFGTNPRHKLADPAHSCDGVELFCFTNRKLVPTKKWTVLFVDCPDPVIETRRYKMFPERYLPGCDYSLWIDANMTIVGDLREIRDRTERFAVFSHPDYDCPYDELAQIGVTKKGSAKDVEATGQVMTSEGIAVKSGSWACTVLSRHHNRTIEECSHWWKLFEHGVLKRDQPHFARMCHQRRWRPEIIPGDMRDNEWLKI